jgi:transcriptional repressor NrdR
MRCPYCTNTSSEVVETRVGEEGSHVRRRRVCNECSKRFTTYERIEAVTLIVKKRDGKREQFSRDKLKIGLVKACEKTTISLQEIEEIVTSIEKQLRCGDSLEVDSTYIGMLIADQLKKKDKLAYIRFASVFKHFVDLDDMAEELKVLNKTK